MGGLGSTIDGGHWLARASLHQQYYTSVAEVWVVRKSIYIQFAGAALAFYLPSQGGVSFRWIC